MGLYSLGSEKVNSELMWTLRICVVISWSWIKRETDVEKQEETLSGVFYFSNIYKSENISLVYKCIFPYCIEYFLRV